MKKAVPMFAVAVILIALTLLRLPDSIRSVDIVSLLGAGVLAGVAIMRGITLFQSE